MQHLLYLSKTNALIGKMWIWGIKGANSEALESKECKYASYTNIYLNTFILVQQACHNQRKYHRWRFERIKKSKCYANREK